MIIKKFYGKNIEEARDDARRNLGNDFIILETTKEEGQQPACITVMIEKQMGKNGSKKLNGSQVISNIKNVVYQRSDAVLKPLRQLQKKAPESIPSPEEERSESNIKRLTGTYEPITPVDEGLQETANQENLSKRQLSLFEYEKMARQSNDFKTGSTEAFQKELNDVKNKLGRLEQMLSESIVLTNIELVSQPSFQQLLKAEIPATTIAGWFRNIMETGISPEGEPEKFMIQLAGQLRNALPDKASQPLRKNIVFTGNSGSGKTSLIMKMIENRKLLNAGNPAVVIVRFPGVSKYYTVLESFARDQDISFYTVSGSSDVSKLLPELEAHDLVLFDTPSINFGSEKAFETYWKLRQLIAAVNPLETHLVLNANTRMQLNDYRKHNPMQPDYIDLTHLDEVHHWGSLIPVVSYFNCPVRFMSHGAEHLEFFETTTFADTILSRS